MGDGGWTSKDAGDLMSEPNDKELLKEYAVGLVARQIREKEHRHIEPLMAIMTEMSAELMREFKTVLNELVSEKVLDWHKTVNGTLMFEFKRE